MNDMQSCLQAYYARAFPDKQRVQINDLVNINAGWESEVYSFDVEHGPPGQRWRDELILRIYPGDDAQVKSAREFQGMSRLHAVGYPVPQVLLLEREDSPFGKPFVIMERVEGQVLWPILFSSPEGKQRELLTLFCELFVQLHTLDWRPFADTGDIGRQDVESPYVFVDQWFDEARGVIERFPLPGFLRMMAWLEARREQVPCQHPSPIHWDYHPNNVLLREDGSAVVIDWTQVGVSDARFDLAWTLLLVGSYQGMEWRQRILREYERLAGVEVEQIEVFDVIACLKRLGSVVVSLSFGPEKMGMRPGAQAGMRQDVEAYQRVYDLLLERAGVRIAEVEEMLTSLSGGV
jgi:aminoglycoside phosphotransferase (APT) family kinase protein